MREPHPVAPAEAPGELRRALQDLEARVRAVERSDAAGPWRDAVSALSEEASGAMAALERRLDQVAHDETREAGIAELRERIDEIAARDDVLASLVEADVPFAERGDESGRGERFARAIAFVAFAPTEEGYRLVELAGPAPVAGGTVEVPGCEGLLVVSRVGASPLPLDDRPCAYLEHR